MRRSSFNIKENHVFIEVEDNPSDKAIGNLVDLPKLMFIDEELGNLQVVFDGGELTRNNNRKKKSEVLQAYICQLCGKCYLHPRLR